MAPAEPGQSATARRRARKRAEQAAAAEQAAPPPVNEWTQHAHAAVRRHEEWARQPNRRRVLNYGEWARREERLARLQRRDEMLRQWAEAEAAEMAHLLPTINVEVMERRKRLVGDLAASLQGAVTLESWVMALYPRAWCRVAIFGGGLGVLLSSMAVSISLAAAWDSSHACLMEATQDATAPSCWRRGWIACGRLACAAWASVLLAVHVQRMRRAVVAGRERGSLAICLALWAPAYGHVSPRENAARPIWGWTPDQQLGACSAAHAFGPRGGTGASVQPGSAGDRLHDRLERRLRLLQPVAPLAPAVRLVRVRAAPAPRRAARHVRGRALPCPRPVGARGVADCARRGG